MSDRFARTDARDQSARGSVVSIIRKTASIPVDIMPYPERPKSKSIADERQSRVSLALRIDRAAGDLNPVPHGPRDRADGP
jgi:hypothetical protein